MKVSILCPSRQRVELLKKSIESLGNGNFEILIAVDNDDPQVKEYRRVAKGYKNRRLFVCKPHGYSELHEYFNLLASEAKGDWLMLWNDDATMETDGWVKVVSKQDHTKPLVLNIWHEVNNLFPLISRAWYEVIGHYSFNTHADSWVQQIGERSGTQVFIDGIKIIHNKPMDETGQASTHTAVNDSGPRFSSPQTQELINKDADTIRRWYEAHN